MVQQRRTDSPARSCLQLDFEQIADDRIAKLQIRRAADDERPARRFARKPSSVCACEERSDINRDASRQVGLERFERRIVMTKNDVGQRIVIFG